MAYAQPRMSAAVHAIEVIHSSTIKYIQRVVDTCQHLKPDSLATNCAYEADE